MLIRKWQTVISTSASAAQSLMKKTSDSALAAAGFSRTTAPVECGRIVFKRGRNTEKRQMEKPLLRKRACHTTCDTRTEGVRM
jgi:hypothetical protein